MTFKNVTLTAYYPSVDEMDGLMEYLDTTGNPLATLQVRHFSFAVEKITRLLFPQDYLDDNAHYVTVSMDENLKIPYGTRICIAELNVHYRRRINFQIRDTASNVKAQGYRRVDICVRSEADSYDHAVNLKAATISF